MADTHETIADIIAEMRRIRVREFQDYADRFEAAHRRERGNAAKLREALDESRRIASDLGGCRLNDYWKLNEIVRVCEAALAAPPRNCDMGTAQEQDERFHRFCVKHHTGSCAGCHNPVGDYTVANGVRECALVWAQMPYSGNDKAHAAVSIMGRESLNKQCWKCANCKEPTAGWDGSKFRCAFLGKDFGTWHYDVPNECPCKGKGWIPKKKEGGVK